MKKSQMEVDFDKWLSGYTGTCSDNHALYQAFCSGYQAAQQNVQPTLESGHEIPAEVMKVESVLPAQSG